MPRLSLNSATGKQGQPPPPLSSGSVPIGAPDDVRHNSSINVEDAYEDPVLLAVIRRFQEYLYLPDPAPLVLALATVVANRMAGPPVWLMIVGPPSSGKTALVSGTVNFPEVIETATLTEASLLSGTASKDRAEDATGGLLKQIGDRGLLVMKDFTSVLSINR